MKEKDKPVPKLRIKRAKKYRAKINLKQSQNKLAQGTDNTLGFMHKEPQDT